MDTLLMQIAGITTNTIRCMDAVNVMLFKLVQHGRKMTFFSGAVKKITLLLKFPKFPFHTKNLHLQLVFS